MRSLLAARLLALLAACGGRAQQPALIDQSHGGVPALPADGDRAFVADDKGLHEVAPDGTSQVVREPPIYWCVTDARARVVWFRTGLGLEVFDLDDRHFVPVILDRMANLSVIIDHDTERLAPDKIDDPVAVVLKVRDLPSLGLEETCADPTTCYDAQGVALPVLADAKERARTLHIEDAEYIGSLAARGAAGSIYSAKPPPALPWQMHEGSIVCGWSSGRMR